MEDTTWIYPSLFYTFAAVAIISALLMVVIRTPLYSTLSLIVTFVMLSGIYVLLNAQLIALINVVVYAGAIMVLFIFVLMLISDGKMQRAAYAYQRRYMGLGAVAVTGILIVTVYAYINLGESKISSEMLAAQTKVGLVENLGLVLFSSHLLPFELTGILFMVALMGAVILGKK